MEPDGYVKFSLYDLQASPWGRDPELVIMQHLKGAGAPVEGIFHPRFDDTVDRFMVEKNPGDMTVCIKWWLKDKEKGADSRTQLADARCPAGRG